MEARPEASTTRAAVLRRISASKGGVCEGAVGSAAGGAAGVWARRGTATAAKRQATAIAMGRLGGNMREEDLGRTRGCHGFFADMVLVGEGERGREFLNH